MSISDIICDICQKKFTSRKTLLEHIQFVHEKEKKFICEICTKTFSRKSVLICHVKDVHEQSGQYGCGFCEKKFFKKNAQVVHERKHTGEKPYLCNHCGKSFDRQSSLNRHSQLHGAKPYRCDNCGESFTSYKARRDGLKCEKCNVALSQVLPQVTPTNQTIDAEDEDEHSIHDKTPSIEIKETKNTREHFIKQEVVSKVDSNIEEEAIGIPNFEVKKDYLVDESNAKDKKNVIGSEISQCQICLKTFTRRSTLNRHKKLHDEQFNEDKLVEIPMQDSKDIDDKVEETYLEQTMEETDVEVKVVPEGKHTGKKSHVCDDCGKSYDIRSSLNRHCKLIHGMLTESSLDNPMDKDGNKETVNAGILEAKIEETVAEEKKICKFCQKTFRTISSLKCHVSDLHEHSGDFACEFCDKKFFKKSSKIEHERTHSGEKPYVCDECGKSFPRKNSLVEHTRYVHEKERQFVCEVCTKEFSRKKGLTKHLKFVHEKIKDFCCEKCSKSFSRKEHLKRHIEVIHEQIVGNPHNCAKCVASFKSEQKLAEHVRFVHENEKNFCCEICTKTFARKADFTRHVADIHEQSGNFACEFCERVFFKPNDKKKHEMKHTNEKPFQCQFCNKTFRAAFDKKAHERKHTGEKPYDCKKCGKGFISNSKKHQHMRTHEEIGQFSSAEQQNVYNALYSTLSMMNNQAAYFSNNH